MAAMSEQHPKAFLRLSLPMVITGLTVKLSSA